MGAIQFEQSSRSLEIVYGGREAPFSGLDSSAPDPYINPTALTQKSANAIVINNSLKALQFVTTLNTAFSATSAVVGIGDLLGQVFAVTYDTATNLITVTTYPNFPSITGSSVVGSIPIPNYPNVAPTLNSLTFKNINGVCFFSFQGCPYILQHNNVAVSILTDYLGCSYLNELNGRLVAADIFQISQTSITETSSNTVTASQYATNLTFNAAQYEYDSGLLRTAGSVAPGTLTDYVIATFPSFNIPADATITGFTLSITWLGQSAGTGQIQNVSIFQAGTSIGTVLTTTDNNFATATPQGYGNATDLWGLTPTPAELNAGNFGFGVQILTQEVGSTDRSFISSMTMTVTYTVTSSSSQVNEYPYQFAWSAPTGQYGQFAPLDADNLVTGAGYNNLPDVEDIITGYFNVGPTGYLIRSQGITEISPLNSGINPFDFNHLWASHKGIGSIYPTTISQYGSLGAFLSDTGIYTIGYDGINTIDGQAKSAIYGELVVGANAYLICAGLSPMQVDGENFLVYAIGAYNITESEVIIYLYNFTTKQWFRFVIEDQAEPAGMAFTAINQLIQASYFNSLLLVFNQERHDLIAFAYPIESSLSNATTYGSTTLIFSAEEIKFLRDITIDAIGLYYNGSVTGAGVLAANYSINGLDFYSSDASPFIFDGTWRYILLYPDTTVGNPYTGNTPQLTATISNTASTDTISMAHGKIVLFGSMDSSQRPA